MTRTSPTNGSKRAEKRGSDLSLPANIAEEQVLVGALILDPEHLDELSSTLDLRAEHFVDEANSRIYTAIVNLFASGQSIDPVLVVAELKRNGWFDEIGPAYFAGTTQKVHRLSRKNTLAHANRVIDAAVRRRMDAISGDLAWKSRDPTQDAEASIDQAISALTGLAEAGLQSVPVSALDVLDKELRRIDAIAEGEGSTGALATGFDNFDSKLGGLHAGELAVLAARPSMGKSSWAFNVATNVAKAGGVVMFASLEMEGAALMQRFEASEARINLHRIRAGMLSPEDRRRMWDTRDRHREAIDRLRLFDKALTVRQIASAARHVRRTRKALSLIVVDYLQLLDADDPKLPREQQVARMSRGLKRLAVDLSVPVLCLSQLNRQAESSKDNRPKLSHLRESGAIEQDADVVMFIHREEYYLRGKAKQEVAGQAEIIVGKNRSGATGEIELMWNESLTRFEDRASARYAEFDDYNRQDEDGPVPYDEF